MPIHFILMDLIGKFKPLHHYALNVIDMLTNNTWCIRLFKKEVSEVVHTYLVNVYCKSGGSDKNCHTIVLNSKIGFLLKLPLILE